MSSECGMAVESGSLHGRQPRCEIARLRQSAVTVGKSVISKNHNEVVCRWALSLWSLSILSCEHSSVWRSRVVSYHDGLV